jgi:hypothetical protein
MADETVQAKDLVAIVKILFSQIIDLHAGHHDSSGSFNAGEGCSGFG